MSRFIDKLTRISVGRASMSCNAQSTAASIVVRRCFISELSSNEPPDGSHVDVTRYQTCHVQETDPGGQSCEQIINRSETFDKLMC